MPWTLCPVLLRKGVHCLSDTCIFHGPVYSWAQSTGGLHCLGNVISAVPGCVALTCMTTSIVGECDLRPQGLPTMLQLPQLPSIFTFTGL